MHEIGRGLDQTDSRPARRAPSKESAIASREIGFEIVQRLRTTIVTKRDSDAFSRTVDERGIENGATEPRQKYVQDRKRPAKIAPPEFRLHFLGHKIMRNQQRAHGVA